jgi:ABC-type multidrug transport system fused ATPase/permease subunit
MWSNYKYFYKEFVKYYYKDFFLLLMFVLIEAIVISLQIISIIPLADFFLDQTLKNPNFITVFIVESLSLLNIKPSLITFFMFFILINFFKSITSSLISYGIIRIKYKVIERFSFDLLDKLLSAKWKFYLKNSSGKIINTYTNEIKKTAGALNDFVTQIALGFKFLTYIITPMVLSFKITLITILISFIFAIPFLLVGRITHKLGKKNVETGNKFMNSVNETLQAIKLILSHARKKISLKKNIENFKEHYKYTIKSQIIESLLVNLYQPFSLLAVSIAIIINVQNSDNISELAAVLWSLMAALPNLNSFIRGNATIQNLIPAFKQFREIENEAIKNKEDFGNKIFSDIKNCIKFNNINFSYYDGEKVLENLNLTLKKNSVTALVGKSGSGKSTVVDLLIGLQNPDSGNIEVDQDNLKNLDIQTFREKTSIISQDVFLFNASIYENLIWANPKASDTEIKTALNLSNSMEFIDKLENGVNTIVGERGVNLSGGQKQRISIARGILRKPILFILDEPTSSLDSISEKLIQESIERIGQQTTTLLIAHRFSTIKRADYIYIIQKGTIIQEGSFNNLKNQGGEFKKLFDNQIV